MAKQLLFDEMARQALLHGAEKVANAVRITLGPKGRKVVLGKKLHSGVQVILWSHTMKWLAGHDLLNRCISPSLLW